MARQSPANPIPTLVLKTFREEVTQYYEERVKSLLACTRSSENLVLDLQFAAGVIIGGRVSCTFSYSFESSGLITSDGSIVCEPAKKAIIRVFNKERKDLIRLLVGLFYIC